MLIILKQLFILYVFWYGLGRAWIEGLRSDSLWLIPDVIRVSQLIAAVSCVAALIVYIINARRIKAGRKVLFGAMLDAEADDVIIEEEKAETPAEETEDNINAEPEMPDGEGSEE